MCDPIDLLKNQDICAKKWSKAFCDHTGFKDEELAHTWFANAMMTMHDSLLSKINKEKNINIPTEHSEPYSHSC